MNALATLGVLHTSVLYLMPRNPAHRFAAFAVAMLAFAAHVPAQTIELRGVVRDSATGAPVAGAVVLALDAVGTTLNRTITGARGQYRLQRPNGALLLRALRIGFRATTERLPLVMADVMTIDIVMVTLPHTLEAMEVTATAARGCPVRPDRAEAFGLLDQARAGLLATVVARERNPAELLVLRFERYLDLDGIDVIRQVVQVDSSKNATTSFNAVRSAVDFVNRGFRSGTVGQYTYFGPDADVLLDERFQSGYCFSLATADTARRAQVGLHFASATRRDGRVDIDGTVWIDTAARALSDIQFRFVGVEALAESFNSGGRVGFRTLPNGIPFIDQWSMRLVGGNDPANDNTTASSQVYAVREVGGELARVRWPDGEVWLGPQSAIHFTAVTREGEPAKLTQLNLVDTDYRATTDSLGRTIINYVLPGPYTVAVDDARLTTIGLQIPTGRSLNVTRGSSSLARVTVSTALQHIGTLCSSDPPSQIDAWLLARVIGTDGKPAAGVKWRISEADGTRWRTVADNGITGTDGLVMRCKGLRRNSSVELAVWRDPKDAIRLQRVLELPLTVTDLQLPALRVAANAPARAAAAAEVKQTVSGTVRDSVTGALIANARVTFVGTPFEGETDATGNFLIGGVALGDYVVEVSTPALDSVGVVSHSNVTLSSQARALELFVPTVSAIMSSACGASDVTGFVVGSVAGRTSTALPMGLRVVAEWDDHRTPADSGTPISATKRTVTWREAIVASSGNYRVCGVPRGTRVVLRTESDSATPWAATARAVSVTAQQPFARVDLQLDSMVTGLATLVGSVVADSARTSMENVEVTLTDIGLTVLTDRRGLFRVSDIPAGLHVLSVKRVGYAPFISSINFAANSVVEQNVELNRASTLATVTVEADRRLKDFQERLATGIGRYLTRADLEKQRGRRLGEVLTQVAGFGAASGGAGHMYVVGKRAPSHIERGGALAPTTAPREPAKNGRPIVSPPGTADPSMAERPSCGAAGAPCNFTADDLREQGFYCPTQAERSQGITGCACYAQVYIDGRLMNNSKPTEPFDANTLPVDEIAGVEFYASAASTPGRYSSLNAHCGVMLVWTRR